MDEPPEQPNDSDAWPLPSVEVQRELEPSTFGWPEQDWLVSQPPRRTATG